MRRRQGRPATRCIDDLEGHDVAARHAETLAQPRYTTSAPHVRRSWGVRGASPLRPKRGDGLTIIPPPYKGD